MKQTLDICFKGARHYIQGGDMLNAAGAVALRQTDAAGLSGLNFMINRMTPHNLSMELVQGEVGAPVRSPVATLSFEAAGSRWHGSLLEESGEPACRHPYDEESLIAQCRVELGERAITHAKGTALTPIEVVVAMTKALHHALYPEAPGKWVFCRWESEHWPITLDAGGVSVMLSKTLGSRLTKSAVISGGKQIGWVYFSAKVEA